MPGKVSRVWASAVLMLILAGRCSRRQAAPFALWPWRGTAIWSSSLRRRARLRETRSASGAGPPAASRASVMRAPSAASRRRVAGQRR